MKFKKAVFANFFIPLTATGALRSMVGERVKYWQITFISSSIPGQSRININIRLILKILSKEPFMLNIAIVLKNGFGCLTRRDITVETGKIKRAMVAALSMLVILTQSIASADETAKRVEVAKTFVTQIAEGKFDKAAEPFDQTMSQALPAESLKQIWDGLTKENGAFQRITETRTEKYLQYDMVFVTCEFQHGMLDAKVVFASGNKITGLFFLPSGKYKPPSYADFSKFDEKEIQIGKGIWSLPGTLSMPKGEGPISGRDPGAWLRSAGSR